MYIFLFISLNQFQGDSGISIAFGVILVGIFFWYIDKSLFCVLVLYACNWYT